MTSAGELRDKASRLWEMETNADRRSFATRPGETLLAEIPAGGSYVFAIVHRADRDPHSHGTLTFRLWRRGAGFDRVPRSFAVTVRCDTLPILADAVAKAIDIEAARDALALPQWAERRQGQYP